jgi:hypothetical protein
MTRILRATKLWGRALLVAAWLVAVAAGAWGVGAYASRPGASGNAPNRWPGSRLVEPSSRGLTLVLFAHPRCPCTRATIAELARVMARCQGRLTANVLFFRPADSSPWERTALWERAAAIPGVSVAWDEGSEEAARFGARTSGQALVYDVTGTLRFSGGITAARGHEGDNTGRDAVVALAMGEAPAASSTPVFGCPLETPCDECRENRP